MFKWGSPPWHGSWAITEKNIASFIEKIRSFICVIRSDVANLKDLVSTEKEHKSSVATSVDKADEDVAKKFDKLVLLLKGLFSYMENIGLKLDRDNGYFETEIYRLRLLCYDWGKIYRSRSDRRDYYEFLLSCLEDGGNVGLFENIESELQISASSLSADASSTVQANASV